MKESARYVKIVEWSDEDQCFVGSCPGLLYGGCHGDDEQAVFAELCEIVDETIELYRKDGKPSLQPPAGKTTPTQCSMLPNSTTAPDRRPLAVWNEPEKSRLGSGR
jgi:predicted RNase H-like HicB family nuclease